jgi:integrase/recombinase XerD
MVVKKLPTFLTEVEQAKLLAAIKPTTRSKLKNLCLIRLMVNNGFRASEVLSLRYGDVDWQTGDAYIREGKGKKDRALRIAKQDLELVKRYAKDAMGTHPKSLVFVTDRGNRLDDRWLRRMVKRVAVQAGISKDVHPHTLRHSFATDHYRDNQNIVELQMLLGHASINTTVLYTHLDPTKAKESTNALAERRLALVEKMSGVATG